MKIIGPPVALATPPSALRIGSGAATVLDGSTVTSSIHHRPTTLRDTVVDGVATSSTRSYHLTVAVTVPGPGTPIRIWTSPVEAWSFPDQFPWGAEALPPLTEWTWWVWSNGVNDTAAWSTNSAVTELSRSATWVNQSYTIIGATHPTMDLTVHAGQSDGTHPTAIGFSVNNPSLGAGLPTSDPDLVGPGKALSPGIVRFGLTSVGSATSWDQLHGVPKFDFTNFDRTVNYSQAVGASIVLTVSAGTWGDGNLLPTGMPLNTALPVSRAGGSGAFPTLVAYASYVGAIVNHTLATHATVLYWSIGNEVPLDNRAVVAGYIRLFNTAASVIHSALPNALVGSDEMMNRTYFSQFARSASGVGFLSFHYYPGDGVCTSAGHYCAPLGRGQGSTDPGLNAYGVNFTGQPFYPPLIAQMMWKNATGEPIPVLDTESNLNGVGGNPTNRHIGTDPRLQSLYGASWLVSTMISGSVENVSALNYFMLAGPAVPAQTITSRFGGWGFGLTSEGPADNDTRFAPYWAMQMWGPNLPHASSGVRILGIDFRDAWAYAARNTSTVSVVIANRVNVPVSYTVNIADVNASPMGSRVLDAQSYSEVYSAATRNVALVKDGVRSVVSTTNPIHFTIQGYGVAIVVESVGKGTSGVPPGAPTPAGGIGSPGTAGPPPSELLNSTAIPPTANPREVTIGGRGEVRASAVASGTREFGSGPAAVVRPAVRLVPSESYSRGADPGLGTLSRILLRTFEYA
jgi:hypothetical protein